MTTDAVNHTHQRIFTCDHGGKLKEVTKKEDKFNASVLIERVSFLIPFVQRKMIHKYFSSQNDKQANS